MLEQHPAILTYLVDGHHGTHVIPQAAFGRQYITVTFEAGRSLDRYLRARVKHPLAGRPELWLGINGRGLSRPRGSTSWS